MPEINISTEIVCNIINKAREFQGKEEVVIPEDVNEYSEDDFMQILADHSNDLTYLEVVNAVNNLEPDQQITLVALMYLGRGDYSVEEWKTCWSDAKDEWTTHTAQYLLSRPLVADYLEEGLNLMGYSCEE